MRRMATAAAFLKDLFHTHHLVGSLSNSLQVDSSVLTISENHIEVGGGGKRPLSNSLSPASSNEKDGPLEEKIR